MLSKESHLERLLLDYLVKVRRFFAWKNPSAGYYDAKQKRFRRHVSPYAINGTPDIICVIEGRFVGFEVKLPGNYQTEAQKSFETRLKEAKGFYYLVRGLEDVERAIKDLEERSLLSKASPL